MTTGAPARIGSVRILLLPWDRRRRRGRGRDRDAGGGRGSSGRLRGRRIGGRDRRLGRRGRRSGRLGGGRRHVVWCGRGHRCWHRGRRFRSWARRNGLAIDRLRNCRRCYGPGWTRCNGRLGRGNELSPCNRLRRRLGWRRDFCRFGHYRREPILCEQFCGRLRPKITRRVHGENRSGAQGNQAVRDLLARAASLPGRAMPLRRWFLGWIQSLLPRSDAMTCRNYRRFHSEAGLKTRATTAYVAQDVSPARQETDWCGVRGRWSCRGRGPDGRPPRLQSANSTVRIEEMSVA